MRLFSEMRPLLPKAKGPDPHVQKKQLQEEAPGFDRLCGHWFPVCRGSRTVPGCRVLWAGLRRTRHTPTSVALEDVTLAMELLQARPQRPCAVHKHVPYVRAWLRQSGSSLLIYAVIFISVSWPKIWLMQINSPLVYLSDTNVVCVCHWPASRWR